MDQAVIDDLKQFITATISQQLAQQTSYFEDRFTTKDDIVALDKKLTAKIDDLQASVSEALDASNDAVDEQLKDHETRLVQLEQRPA